MAASYPSSLPIADAAGANLSSNPHSALHDDMYDEIVAIATELGTNPKGTSASVKARLDLVQTGEWTSYTPTLTQGTTAPKTVTRAKYIKIGRTVHFDVDLAVTGAGATAGTFVSVGLPVTAAASRPMVGVGSLFDSSANFIYVAVVEMSTTTTVAMFNTFGSGSADPRLGVAGFTAALASGDYVKVSGTYEAAS